ncbi:1767_t:CDS:10 [Acaulospora morrowiae]|uniref:1767_t:CDS:1 n=1 Tax=Acaulospora morrowiae TaxID=94023 RepID=A0A9N9G823_9GLOM|nr:1767_t:CDS:10 [Acaulospora morrowiae]
MDAEEPKTDEVEESIEQSMEVEKKQDEIKLAKVEYDYQANEYDELSLDVGDIVTILEQGENGWWKGDLNGKIGSFPANHVKLIEKKSAEEENDENINGKGKITKKLFNYGVKPGGVGSLFAGGFPLKQSKRTQNVSDSSDSPKTEEKHENLTHVLRKTNRTLSEDDSDYKQVSTHSSENARKRETATKVTPPLPRLPPKKPPPKPKLEPKATVLYDYDAEADDEISLREGEIITVLDKTDGEGWWKGRNDNGQVGIFPSTFVEEIVEKEIQPQEQIVEVIERKEENHPPPPIPRSTRPQNREETHEQSHNEDSSSHQKPSHGGNLPPLPSEQSSTHKDPPSTPSRNRRSLNLSTKRQSLHEAELPSTPTRNRQSQHEEESPLPKQSLIDNDTDRLPDSPVHSDDDQSKPKPPSERRKSKSISSINEDTTEESQDTVNSPVSSARRPIPPPRSKSISQENKNDAPKITSPLLAKPPSIPRPGIALAKPPSIPKRSPASYKSTSSVSDDIESEKDKQLELDSRGYDEEEYHSSKTEETTKVKVESLITKENLEETEIDVSQDGEMAKNIDEHVKEDSVSNDEQHEKNSEKKEPEVPPIPTGPRLTNLGAERPAIKGRRPPAKHAVVQSQTEILEQAVAQEKDEVEEPKQKPTNTPPKPMKPNMFKLPIAGGGLPNVALRSVPKKPVELSTSSTSTETNITNVEPINKPSVKSISSRFNIPNQSTEVEIRLKKWVNEEINKVKSHFEAQLSEERMKREELEAQLVEEGRKREELEELIREIQSGFES